jgi:uncharacterized protein YfbU (UPF0304 family)
VQSRTYKNMLTEKQQAMLAKIAHQTTQSIATREGKLFHWEVRAHPAAQMIRDAYSVIIDTKNGYLAYQIIGDWFKTNLDNDEEYMRFLALWKEIYKKAQIEIQELNDEFEERFGKKGGEKDEFPF